MRVLLSSTWVARLWFLSFVLSSVSFVFGSGLALAKAPEWTRLEDDRVFQHRQKERTRSSFVATTPLKNGAMVVAAHPIASQAGMRVLRAGGNAVDAAVAVSLTLSVVRPHSTGIGGGGFLLLYDPKDKQTAAYDFRERAPRAASRDMYIDAQGKVLDFVYKGQSVGRASVNGHLAAGVPGLIRGLHDVHKAHGKLSWSALFNEAIQAAEKGFSVYPSLHGALKRKAKVLKAFPASAAVFLNAKGEPWPLGATLVQKDLAKTLRSIAQLGAEGFYQGWVAKALIEEMKRGQGLITQKDLVSYRTVKRKAVEGSYRGYRIASMPPPSSGGVHLIQMLNILEQVPMSRFAAGDPRAYAYLIEAMRFAYADRATYLGDPDFVSVPTAQLLQKSYAASIFKRFDLSRSGRSSDWKSVPLPQESGSTVHLSIVDARGMAVSSTQTINTGLGSGVVVAGTGIVLNNEMDDFSIKPGVPNSFGLVGGEANAIAARKTMLSSMTPTLVFGPDGRLDMVVGSPGGSRIINATLQTILHRLDFKMLPADAVHHLRIHHQWLPDKVMFEQDSISTRATFAILGGLGYTFEKTSYPIGNVQAIFRDRMGSQWVGVSDTRAEGVPVGAPIRQKK